MPWRARLAVLVALLPLPALAVAAALLGDAGQPPAPAGDRVTTTTAPALPEPVLRRQFLDAYERSRLAEWLIRYDFTRRLRNGSTLDLRVTELNRPPDHLSVGLGGISGRVGGRTVVCEEVGGRSICVPEGPAASFEEGLAAQLSELRDVLEPPAKWYAVEDGGIRRLAGEPARCFVLRRVADVFSPPYGERAEYCFATSDGVPLHNRVERREGVDQRLARAVTRQVTDADIAALLNRA